MGGCGLALMRGTGFRGFSRTLLRITSPSAQPRTSEPEGHSTTWRPPALPPGGSRCPTRGAWFRCSGRSPEVPRSSPGTPRIESTPGRDVSVQVPAPDLAPEPGGAAAGPSHGPSRSRTPATARRASALVSRETEDCPPELVRASRPHTELRPVQSVIPASSRDIAELVTATGVPRETSGRGPRLEHQRPASVCLALGASPVGEQPVA